MDLIGHTQLWETVLQRQRNNRLAHAMLFVGSESVGKTTIAQKLAATILCELNNECAQCDSCRAIARGLHPDLFVVPHDERTIGIESIRACRTFAAGAPLMGSTKVMLIPHADRMTHEAANALLKTLEDPAPGLLMLLTAEIATALPATIRSRVEEFHCARVPDKELRTALNQRDISAAITETVVRMSDGRPGRALALAADDEMRETSDAMHERWVTLIEKPSASFLAFTAAHEDREDMLPSLIHGQSVLRQMLRSALEQSSERTTARHSIRWYERAIRALQRATTQLTTTNANPKLIFETCLLDFLA